MNDYHAVNSATWTFWQEQYGGGPAVNEPFATWCNSSSAAQNSSRQEDAKRTVAAASSSRRDPIRAFERLAKTYLDQQQQQPEEDVLFSDSDTSSEITHDSPCSKQGQATSSDEVGSSSYTTHSRASDFSVDVSSCSSPSEMSSSSPSEQAMSPCTPEAPRDTESGSRDWLACSPQDAPYEERLDTSAGSSKQVTACICDLESPDAVACAICFEEYEKDDDRIFLPCCHSFHFRCVEEWISTRNTCPTCRCPVNDQNLIGFD